MVMGPGRFELPTKELKAPCSTIELCTLTLGEFLDVETACSRRGLLDVFDDYWFSNPGMKQVTILAPLGEVLLDDHPASAGWDPER